MYRIQTRQFNSKQYNGFHEPIRHDRDRYGGGCLVFYRPPTCSNQVDFLNEAEIILKNLSHHKADIKIIASDLNFGNIYCKYHPLPPKPLDSSAPDLFASHGFHELIDIPTQVTESSTSLVDLIFINEGLESSGYIQVYSIIYILIIVQSL